MSYSCPQLFPLSQIQWGGQYLTWIQVKQKRKNKLGWNQNFSFNFLSEILLPERCSQNKKIIWLPVFLLGAEFLNQSFPGSEGQVREHLSTMAPPLDERHSEQETSDWQEYQHLQWFTMGISATNSYFRRWKAGGGGYWHSHTLGILLLKGTRQESRKLASYCLHKQVPKIDCTNCITILHTQQHGVSWNAFVCEF